MKFEHFALNVPDPVRMADWYVNHLAMKIVLSQDSAPFTRFLSDETGRVTVELYSNAAAAIPEYRNMHHLAFHFAFEAADAEAARAGLLGAGATDVEVVRPADGSVLYMLRDPWGLPLQICQRAHPFVA
jgi:glyoxylase I family protein